MPKCLSPSLPVVAVALMAVGCATTTVPFRQAPAQPAATGEVKIRPEPNGNALVKLRVEHLADPSRLTPPRARYLVWTQHPEEKSALLGRLAPNKKLEALGTVLPLPFQAEEKARKQHRPRLAVSLCSRLEPAEGSSPVDALDGEEIQPNA